MTLTGVKSMLTTSSSPSQDAVAIHFMKDSADNLINVSISSLKGFLTCAIQEPDCACTAPPLMR